MLHHAVALTLLLAYAEARFGQEQIPIQAISQVQGGASGAAPTIAGAAISDLLAGTNACDKLKRADQIVAELGGGADAIAAAIGMVLAEKNVNPFVSQTPNVCSDPTLPTTEILRGRTPLVDPAFVDADIANALSAQTANTPLDATGKSVFDLLVEAGVQNINGQDAAGGITAGGAAGGGAAAPADPVAAPPVVEDPVASETAVAEDPAVVTDAPVVEETAAADAGADVVTTEVGGVPCITVLPPAAATAAQGKPKGDKKKKGKKGKKGGNKKNKNKNKNKGNNGNNNNNNGNNGGQNAEAGNLGGGDANANCVATVTVTVAAGGDDAAPVATEAPAIEDPVVEAPVVEAPAVEAPAVDNGAAAGVDFGLCTPTMSFEGGRANRNANEFTFLPIDPLCAQGQQEALNPNIITNRICDQLTNVCQANDAAKALCKDAQAQILALGTRDKSTADTWNTLLGFDGAVTNPSGGPAEPTPARRMRRHSWRA